MPTARGSVACCAVDTSLYVLGGRLAPNSKSALATVEHYDADADRWEPCPSMPEPLSLGAAVAW